MLSIFFPKRYDLVIIPSFSNLAGLKEIHKLCAFDKKGSALEWPIPGVTGA